MTLQAQSTSWFGSNKSFDNSLNLYARDLFSICVRDEKLNVNMEHGKTSPGFLLSFSLFQQNDIQFSKINPCFERDVKNQ